jgi:hypothetical protein
VVALLACCVTDASADPTTLTTDSAEGIFGEALSGQGQVDNRTGAMTWSYPFELPAARGRPQPHLSLSYNSSWRDREAGYGWGLNLPTIERTPLSRYPCSATTGTPIVCGEPSAGAQTEERYACSGQPLVLICELSVSSTPVIAGCGDEPHPAWARTGGWKYFRRQVEDEFARFYLSDDRHYWRVQLKGGDLLDFGEPPDGTGPGVEHDLYNANAILRWRLVRHSDAAHLLDGRPANFVEYHWRSLGRRGLLYLTDIYDTPRVSGQHGDTDFAHHTQLSWQTPDFPQTYYADPYRGTPDLRLTSIAISSMPWDGTGPREVVRWYRLRYLPAQGPVTNVALSQVFRLWNHSFLAQIQMQGRCGEREDTSGNIPAYFECPVADPADQL